MTSNRLTKALVQLRQTLAPSGEDALTDAQLLARFVAGQDGAAFAALVRRHGPMVLGVCRRLLRNPHDAEDAFQATFLVLVRKAGSVRKREAVGSWLYGVAYRTAREARAIQARRRAREVQVDDLPHPAVAPTEVQDWRPLLDRELVGLPEKYRTPLLLCDLEGKGRREVARELGVPDGTLSSRLSTARLLLAKRLARYGLALSGGVLAAALAETRASAFVPAALFPSTTRAALLVAAGQATLAGSVPAEVAALTEGVLRTMLLLKIKTAAVMLCGVAVVGLATGGVFYQARAGAPDSHQTGRSQAWARGAQATAAGDPDDESAKDLRRAAEEARDRERALRAELEEARRQAEAARAEAEKHRERAEAERRRAEDALAEARAQVQKALAAEKAARQEVERVLYATGVQKAQQDFRKAAGLPARPAEVDPRVDRNDLETKQAALRKLFDKKRAELEERLRVLENQEKEFARGRAELQEALSALYRQEKEALDKLGQQKAGSQGRKLPAQASPAPTSGDKLDQILERLDRLEQRLDRIERR